jgi:hypothetical protein
MYLLTSIWFEYAGWGQPLPSSFSFHQSLLLMFSMHSGSRPKLSELEIEKHKMTLVLEQYRVETKEPTCDD